MLMGGIMKRSILYYRLYKTMLVIVLLLFVAFLIASINIKKTIFTSLAIVFGILTIIFVFGHSTISQNAWYKQAKRELRKRAYDKIKTSPKGFAQYVLPLETSHSEMDFSQLLEGYTRYKLNNAVVYVKQTISPYNTKKIPLMCFIYLKTTCRLWITRSKPIGCITPFHRYKSILQARMNW